MVQLELLSGHIHQYITFEENDRIYRDLLKPNRIKPFSKYPEFDPNIQDIYKILVKTDIKLFSNGLEINLDDEINFDLDVIQLTFNLKYVCRPNPIIDTLIGCYKTFNNIEPLEKDYLDYLIKFMCYDPSVITYIPSEIKTYDLCEYAVNKLSDAIEFVPDIFKTPNICSIAVRRNGSLLEFVPDKLKSQELCELAIRCPYHYNGINNGLKYIPNHLKNENIYKKSVYYCGLSVQFIPKENRTEEICNMTIKQNFFALEYVPIEMKTYELCKLAVRTNHEALKYIPDDIINKELCDFAFLKNSLVYIYIPDEMKTDEMREIFDREHPNLSHRY